MKAWIACNVVLNDIFSVTFIPIFQKAVILPHSYFVVDKKGLMKLKVVKSVFIYLLQGLSAELV